MKQLTILILFLGFNFAHANQMITAKVQGMVCAFCAQGVTKSFEKIDAVKTTHVDLDKMEVHITLKEGKTLDEATIKKTIESSGFKFTGTK